MIEAYIKVSIATELLTADVPEAVMARWVLARRGEILWRVFIFAIGIATGRASDLTEGGDAASKQIVDPYPLPA